MVMKAISNEAECRLCGDQIFSGHRHDYKECKCGAIAVDGGLDYQRWVGHIGNIIDRSMCMSEEAINDIKEAVTWGQTTGRNEFGVALAVLRALRKNNLLDEAAFKWKQD